MKQLLVLLALFPMSVLALCALPTTTSVFDLYSGGHHIGQITRSVKVSASKYQINVTTKAGFLFFTDTISQQSRGTILRSQLRPRLFSTIDKRKGRVEQIYFNWSKARALVDYQGKKSMLSTHPGMYDALSYQLVLRCQLESSIHSARFSVLSDGQMKHYQLNVVRQHDVLTTPLGKLDTIEVAQRTAKHSADLSLLWFAPKYHYALVESAYVKNGKQQMFAIIKTMS